jgi:NTP pyrophosphatase (non-canonical NTP hydrolase)
VLSATCDPRVVSANGEPERLAGGPLLAWLAAEAADVCVLGKMVPLGDATCLLTLVPVGTAAVLRFGRPVCLRGTVAYDEHSGQWLALRLIQAVEPDGRERRLDDLPVDQRLAVMAESGMPAIALHAHQNGAAQLDEGLYAAVRRVERKALSGLARSCEQLSDLAVPSVGHPCDLLRPLQDQCLRLYGRLEPDRALAWALEELGELAQAMRRNEPAVRLEEELGEVLAWVFCLANINRVDLAHAFGKAFSAERQRQLDKYGAIRPYHSTGETA